MQLLRAGLPIHEALEPKADALARLLNGVRVIGNR
jgi:hypothetical protein